MNRVLYQLYERQGKLNEALAILVVEKEKSPAAITDGCDVIILSVVDEATANDDWVLMHYNVDGKKISVHFVKKELMYQTLIVGNQRRLIAWLLNGEIRVDNAGFLQEMRKRLELFPLADREKKMTIQFTKLLRRFEEGRTLFHHGHYFDAFSNMMHALHHLARLSVIYHGYYPEVTVWEQVRHIEPHTYKLYQELLNSEETLEERIELLILATEFAIQSKTEIGSKHFLSLMSDDLSSISDLMTNPEIEDYRIDLELLLHHLVEKGFLTYERRATYRTGMSELYYRLRTNV